LLRSTTVTTQKIVGGRKALNGALINLLENAMQATPPGGKICLSGKKCGDLLAISVSDSGPGVPFDKQSRIFEPFFTTKGQGYRAWLGNCLRCGAGARRSDSASLSAG
jgi:signal transduction histidine kinase